MTGKADIEKLVDAWVNRAASYYGKSDFELKRYCAVASPIVGKYIHYGTKAIADRIKRSPSTVENHSHAHWLYIQLRNSAVRKRVRTLWRALPASHWWQAWTIQKAGYDAFQYLNNAELHGWSGREMMDAYKKDLEAGRAPLMFTRGVIALRGLAQELREKHCQQLNEGQLLTLAMIDDNFPMEG